MGDIVDMDAAREARDAAILRAADAHVESTAALLGEDPGLDPDGGQRYYDALAERDRRAIAHAAFVLKDAERYPTLDLMLAITKYHDADARVVLLAFGWRPPAGHRLTERERVAARLSYQIAYDVAWATEEAGYATDRRG